MASGQFPPSLLDRVSCGVCTEHYDSSSHVPKLLPCQHTFCIRCLFSLSTGFVQCPICRCKHPIPSEGFVTNRAVLDIAEELMRSHVITPFVSPAPPSLVPKAPTTTALQCAIHEGQECVLVCIDCLAGLCLTCLTDNYHGAHRKEKVSDARASLRPRYMKCIEEEQASIDIVLSRIQNSICSFEELEKAEEDVKALSDKIIEVVSQWKNDQVSTIGRFTEEAAAMEDTIQVERSTLQSLIDPDHLDMQTLLNKLSKNPVKKNLCLKKLGRCLKEMETYYFGERCQLLLRKLQSVLNCPGLLTCRFLRATPVHVLPDTSCGAKVSVKSTDGATSSNESVKFTDGATGAMGAMKATKRAKKLKEEIEFEKVTHDKRGGNDVLILETNDAFIFYNRKSCVIDICAMSSAKGKMTEKITKPWDDIKSIRTYRKDIETVKALLQEERVSTGQQWKATSEYIKCQTSSAAKGSAEIEFEKVMHDKRGGYDILVFQTKDKFIFYNRESSIVDTCSRSSAMGENTNHLTAPWDDVQSQTCKKDIATVKILLQEGFASTEQQWLIATQFVKCDQ